MSRLTFSFDNETDIQVDSEPLLTAAELICAAELPDGICEIGLLICSDEKIRKFNQLYRADDSVTDVLCFNGTDGLPGEITKGQPNVICDILIDIKQLERQKGFKSLNKELMEIFIHGLLHGFGYDHIRSGDSKQMKEKEEHYIKLMEGMHACG